MSRLRVEVDGFYIHPRIIAAHRDSVLVQITAPKLGAYVCDDRNYFIYCAGDAAADPSRPPSLSLLPLATLNEAPRSCAAARTRCLWRR
jgi:hypothetical protein